MLDGRLEEQLKAWAQVKTEEVPKINELIKQADIPALTVASPLRSQETGVASPTPAVPVPPNGEKPPAVPTPPR
jgi:hypothetical protein